MSLIRVSTPTGFQATSRGNCILVTTRMKWIASLVVVDLHMLGKLGEDHCWSIFKQRAFVDGQVPEGLVSMGNRTVEMCQGLPLTASVLGGLTRSQLCFPTLPCP
ncbi:hypothetical protein H5410_030045 [Solanum commersonii]|uniref:NB-ARC domain-containing protein n=1 Tax=Solanum commersonii TaxID=4109 RepID=A0A9J5YD58_SOLCO|nr:hypothetical protein H5410_030045 [Solanum commersonii]